MSGHKIHAPKGIGALYLSDRLVQAFQPPYLGGEQERQMRPGTETCPMLWVWPQRPPAWQRP